ncbi:hypothetical protein [Lewinella sp. W8]|uniref:hypothetical protein n=1 Tax=Lewinella sp. W8 TaxID=2528208 RepID=UPI00106802BC|nr:hypothetical protein [Lewinella sp. W8]MTB53925.1 hypothetical protein [Lewinella sp. W8]
MAFIPVNPAITKNGSLLSLIPKFGEERAKVVPLEETNNDLIFVNFNVVQESISTSVAATIKLSPIFGGDIKYNDKAYYLDAIAYVDKYDKVISEDRVVYATRWGVGIRIVLKLTNLDVNFQLSLNSIGAAVELGKVNARYEIQGLGLGIDGLNIVLSKLSPVDDFTYDTYLAIKKKVIPELSKYIAKNKETLIPQPIAVEINEPLSVSNLYKGKTVAFTVKQIARGKSLEECLRSNSDLYDEDIILDVYEEMVGKVKKTDTPSDDAVSRARNWLRDIR